MLNNKQRRILALAFYNSSGITMGDCYKIYTTPHHIRAVLKHLHLAGYLAENNLGRFVLTEQGKDALGIERDDKLNKYIEVDLNG